MNGSRRGFLKSVLGLAVGQAFLPPIRESYTTCYRYGGTITGRFSCKGPNLQDIKWDKFGESGKDTIFAMDYGAMEARVLAQVSGYRYAVRELLIEDYLCGIEELDHGYRFVRYNSGDLIG